MSRSLYPSSPPRKSGWLSVGDGHELYYEEAGNEGGLPVVFLHGGPGGGCKPSHRQFFDPARYRSVIFDQRGAGQSKPFGATTHNTTAHLVSDLEALREHLALPAWVLFAGSWGTALALAYAEAHPTRVLGLVSRGAFLARAVDLEWFLHAGAARMLPRAWHLFNDRLGHPSDLAAHIHAKLFGPVREEALEAARAWNAWSGEVVMYSFDNAPSEPEPPEEHVLGKARIELHYAVNRYFLRENQLLADLHRFPKVPVHLIHGQRDLTCAPESSWALHRALPQSTLEILRTGGHLSGEALMTDALLRAADAMADLLA